VRSWASPQRLLPKHHLNNESKDAVKLVAGLLATLSALVLGLLIASAKSSFDAVSNALKQNAARGVVVDRLLGQYGPEAKGAREELKRQYGERVARLFPEARDNAVEVAPVASAVEGFHRSLRALVPTNDEQRAILSRLEQLTDEVTQTGTPPHSWRCSYRGSSFKSRVAAIGPEIAYQFMVAGAQWSANLRAYWEFYAQNRYKGHALFATLNIPLGSTNK
jgi:hypothetical protein